MAGDVHTADEALGVAVLLHPHPDFGGNRFHPFIDGLFRRLPEVAVSAVRFDFTSAERPRFERRSWPPSMPRPSNGRSFRSSWPATPSGPASRRVSTTNGSGVGTCWHRPPPCCPPPLSGATPRPKALAVPEYDHFSPPEIIADVVAGWATTTVTTVPNTDHFLGVVRPMVDAALDWIGSTLAP
jgi:hypothetical protein